MNTRIWIPLCAMAALLAACGRGEDPAETGEVSIETMPDEPAAPAGETAATPADTQADPPPPDTSNPGG